MVRSQTYEITFLGQAGATVRAEFDDCEVSIGPGTTTLRAELPDRGALTRQLFEKALSAEEEGREREKALRLASRATALP